MNNMNSKEVFFSQKGDERGHLVIIESQKEVPFDIKRVFYMYGSDKDVVRGKHANFRSEFVLINVKGSSKIKVMDGKDEVIYELNVPHSGVYVPRMLWKEMYDFSEDSILLVLSNELYDKSEYISDFEVYKKLMWR